MIKNSNLDFAIGFKLGLPILFGYLPVAFTFGGMAVNEGLMSFSTIIMSLTNLTSSGQFACTQIIAQNGTYIEIILMTLIINVRYFLMSISLSQKLEAGIPIYKKAIFAFAITDEVFGVASTRKTTLTFKFMLGLIIPPIIGWTLGTALGSIAMNFIPTMLKDAMGIALYGMFISFIIPPTFEDSGIMKVTVFSIVLSFMFYYIPFLGFVSPSVAILVVGISGALLGAIFFPIKIENTEVGQCKQQ